MLLHVHQSNFRVVGFTEQPRLAELAALAQRAGLPLVDDLGSGALVARSATSRRRAASLAAGRRPRLLLRRQAPRRPAGRDRRRARRRSSSGCAGTRCSARCARTSSRSPRSRPRSRSTSTRSARGARSPCCACSREPARRCAREPSAWPALSAERSRRRSRASAAARCRSRARGFACAARRELAEPLRAGDPPVIGVVRDGRLLLDCRTLADAEIDDVALAVRALRRR